MKKIVIFGANGFIGRSLSDYFSKAGDEVHVVQRKAKKVAYSKVFCHLWDGKSLGEWVKCLEGADMLINLAGKSVDCRYTEKNKKAIFDSRTATTALIGKAINGCKNPPKLWLNSSSATIYPHSELIPNTESTNNFADDFSVQVCKKWEQTVYDANVKIPVIIMRIAIVLGKEGGVFSYYKNLAKFGLGGKHGNGTQMFSWIHIRDLYRAIQFLYQNVQNQEFVLNEKVQIFNLSAPNPLTNEELMRQLKQKVKVPFGLNLKEWMLDIGTFFMQTEKELLLKSRFVLPEKLLKNGFQFQYAQFEEVLEDLI